MEGGMMVDENGLPIDRARPAGSEAEDEEDTAQPDPADRPAPPRLDQQWIDNVLGRTPRQRQPAQQRPDNP
jgi:penicillin-binding protein 1A